jgi:hypothetical protein
MTEHIFKLNRWGDSCSAEFQREGMPYRMTGFRIPRPKDGDIVQLPSGRRFLLSKVETCRDPEDMWLADGKLLEN